MKIYTKTGDKGDTSLFGGKRINKGSLRISAVGGIDELNAYIGTIIAAGCPEYIKNDLLNLQKNLFVAGADVATPFSVNKKLNVTRVKAEQTKMLEQQIDEWQQELPALRNFILPGGSNAGAMLHFSRTICRRVERILVSLNTKEKLNQELVVYFNRLSDWLFILARYINTKESQPENIWTNT